MNFDTDRLDALDKKMDEIIKVGQLRDGYYKIGADTVKELIADLREWQQVAKDNADAIHRIEKSIAHTKI
jgi:hypothetical protein